MITEDFIAALKPRLEAGQFVAMTLSNPIKSYKENKKISISPVQLKSGYHLQFGFDAGRQMRHQNLALEAAIASLSELLPKFRQVNCRFVHEELQAHLSPSGTVSVLSKNTKEVLQPVAEHNRSKHYVLPDGKSLDFLIALGLMSPAGQVFKARYDKFRQINRFIELVDNVLAKLPSDKTLKIIDFACGKAYLTFALYHYLVVIKARSVEILGLDLKQDLIESSNNLALQLGMSGLRFETGDIAGYKNEGDVDMVLSLHACDTATDLALAFAVTHRAKVILSAPCCQHQLFGQIEAPSLKVLLKQGLIKERFAALATDALRCSLLEQAGYQVDTVEFVDPEHTPKNLLIRASQNLPAAQQTGILKVHADYQTLRDSLGARPLLEALIVQDSSQADQ